LQAPDRVAGASRPGLPGKMPGLRGVAPPRNDISRKDMGDVQGFMKYKREELPDRPAEERLGDYRDVHTAMPEDKLQIQAARCMDCGTPFCHTGFSGCPINNIIPDWNDLVYRNRWQEAIEALHSTNNFPEFTGQVCPAPCEGACVLGINEPPVTIKNIEHAIIEHAFREGWVKPQPPKTETGKKVAVVGSGPAGLAAAQQLRRAGHKVTVFEKDDRIGGLLIYGIPDFKLEKEVVDRRVALMAEEGVTFVTNAHVGVIVSVAELRKNFDALCLCGGAQEPRDLPIEGRNLKGVHFAMDFLPQQNRRVAGEKVNGESITAKDKHVVVIGGGDTGSDCIGTSLRQGCKSLTSFEVLPKPPENRAKENPWPLWPQIFRVSSSHAEGGKRDFSVLTKRFIGENGVAKKLQACHVEFVPSDNGTGRSEMREVPSSQFEIPAELVLLAMGFLGPVKKGMIEQLGVELDQRGNVKADEDKMTSIPGIFTAGDMTRGQSLVVWAIHEGRAAARSIDKFLMGSTILP